MSAPKRSALMGTLLVRKGAATSTGQTRQSVEAEAFRVASRSIVALPTSRYLTGPAGRPTRPAGVKMFGRRKPQGGGDGADGPSEKKMRLTLGMDSQLHLRLKLAAVHQGTNMRSLILTAIDDYLSALGPEIQDGHCACLQAGPRKGTCDQKKAGSDDGTGSD